MGEEGEEELNRLGDGEKEKSRGAGSENKKKTSKKMKKRKSPEEFTAAVGRSERGVCYLSRVPPHMDPSKLRHILSQYGDIERLYITPVDSAVQELHKKAGGYQGKQFSEGWVEFAKKSVAKRVANMVNGEQIGGKRRSSFYYDIWNIKYLSKFKWDNLTEEIAYKNATREQKLALEKSAAKREQTFYLSKVKLSHNLSSMQERIKKKQRPEDLESNGNTTVDPQEAKVIRQFPQNRPVDDANEKKAGLSKAFLAGVFGHSSSRPL